MRPVFILDFRAISAAGAGEQALGLAAPGTTAPTFVTRSTTMQAQGFRRPNWAAIPDELLGPGPIADRATHLLMLVTTELLASLDQLRPGWRSMRVGLALGTSSGGLATLCSVLVQRAAGARLDGGVCRQANYFAPAQAVRQLLGIPLDLEVQVLGACASSVVALGLAARALAEDRVDLVLWGGYDALHPFVLAGFESLQATAESSCQPFRLGRDGLVVGEAAAMAALVALPSIHQPAIVGFGTASDAFHVTAPQPQGEGLVRAARAALFDAGLAPNAIDLLGAHGTGTGYNDAAEASALTGLVGQNDSLVVHAPKGSLGHCLGAAGILEILGLFRCLEAGWLPASFGEGPTLTMPGRILERTQTGQPRVALKLAAAFGGLDAAVVLGAAVPVAQRSPRPVTCLGCGDPATVLDPELARTLCSNPARIERLEPGAALVLAAVLGLHRQLAGLDRSRTGLVVGTATASIEANERFDRRRRQGGPRTAEPRRFPATTPNLVASETSIALGLLGPCFAVGASLAAAAEALLVGHDLVASGDADAILVVAAEELGEVVRELWREAGWPLPAAGACAALLVPHAEPAPVLVRDQLRAGQEMVRSGLGRLEAAEPGWPVLRSLVEAASAR